jgi:hypothetical protein
MGDERSDFRLDTMTGHPPGAAVYALGTRYRDALARKLRGNKLFVTPRGTRTRTTLHV